ncbi:MAG: hypothetical protein ACK2T7_02455, partial [Anaerolineales bacterium]
MKRRSSFTLGFLLILLGGWFLAVQFIPGIGDWMARVADWPFWVIGPGLFFILAGLISGVTDLMIPGSIISGIGLILYYQNATGDWQSWSYAWALIIVFVGIGIFLANLFKGDLRTAIEEGGSPFMTGAIMFLIFGSIFRAAFGQTPLLGDYWPVLLIVFGLWLLIKPFFRRKRKASVIVTINTDDEVDAAAHEFVQEVVTEAEDAA